MRKTSPNASRYTAIGLVCLGLIMLFLSWNAAAGVENGIDIRAQFPYLLSGGLGGVALIGTGLTLIRVFESRRDALLVVDRLERLLIAVERLETGRMALDLAEANEREMDMEIPVQPVPPMPPYEPVLG